MEINRKRLTDTFLRLTEIDSLSFSERQMADWLTLRLTELGLKVAEDDAGGRTGGSAGNLFARLTDPDASEEETVLFCAHMDTVQPGTGRRAHVEQDGVICSDGRTVLGADDQAGIAEILEALQVIHERRLPHRNVEVLFTIGEEAYTAGAGAFDFHQSRAREAFVLDLSGPVGGASLSEPTLLSFLFSVHGKAAHAGFAPENGVHAIAAASAAIAQTRQGRIDEHTTLNIGMIRGGTATNVVPDLVQLQGEIRSAGHLDALHAYGKLEEEFRSCVERCGARMDSRYQIHLTAYQVPEDSRALGRYLKTLESLGIPPVLRDSFGGSDNNVLRRQGIDGICIANAMENIHTTNEFTSVDEMAAAAGIVLRLMLREETEL